MYFVSSITKTARIAPKTWYIKVLVELRLMLYAFIKNNVTPVSNS